MSDNTATFKPLLRAEASPKDSELTNSAHIAAPERQEVFKTYKLYIGGNFPRSESGRYYRLPNASGRVINVARASRKDFRNAVQSASAAFKSWAGQSAYLRGQILFRIAEMVENRREQFINELWNLGLPRSEAAAETHAAIDRIVHYAGWCDKYSQLFSTVNPVASSHFNFSTVEPVGVVGIIAPEQSGLLGLISCLCPVIAGGNTCVVLTSSNLPLPALALAEALQTSDVPAGVVNILTGFEHELCEHFCSHMELKALLYARPTSESLSKHATCCADNLKRIVSYAKHDWQHSAAQSPYCIKDFQETKTTWHPIGL
jgi:acyl-CoA reductase-like NAD-dependent aldehyde dehydrogenase